MADPQIKPDPASHDPAQDPAKGRFFFLAAHRLIGAALVVPGMLAMQGALDWGKGIGKVLAITGLIVFFVVPLVLARAWRSAKDTGGRP